MSFKVALFSSESSVIDVILAYSAVDKTVITLYNRQSAEITSSLFMNQEPRYQDPNSSDIPRVLRFDIESLARGESETQFRLKQAMMLEALSIAMDINNMFFADSEVNNAIAAQMVAVGVLTRFGVGADEFADPIAVNDTASDVEIDKYAVECQFTLYDLLQRQRLANKDGYAYLSPKLANLWLRFERIINAIRQREYIGAGGIGAENPELTPEAIDAWLEKKKTSFTNKDLSERELDIMTSHIKFRTEVLKSNYSDLSETDQQCVDSLYEIRKYLVVRYNELNDDFEGKPDRERIWGADAFSLTAQESTIIGNLSKLSGLIVDIEITLRKIVEQPRYSMGRVYDSGDLG